jgi:hypothetical protein
VAKSLERELDNLAYKITRDLPRCDVCGEVCHVSKLKVYSERTEYTEPVDLCPECYEDCRLCGQPHPCECGAEGG